MIVCKASMDVFKAPRCPNEWTRRRFQGTHGHLKGTRRHFESTRGRLEGTSRRFDGADGHLNGNGCRFGDTRERLNGTRRRFERREPLSKATDGGYEVACSSRRAREGEHAPGVRAARAPELCSGAVGVFSDHSLPERKGLRVSLGNSNDPPTGKTIPKQESRSAAHPGTAVAANDEELGDVEHFGIVRRRRATCDQHEAHDPSAVSDEKREPAPRL